MTVFAEVTQPIGRSTADRIRVPGQTVSLPSSSNSTPEKNPAEKVQEAEGRTLATDLTPENDTVVVSGSDVEPVTSVATATANENQVTRISQQQEETGPLAETTPKQQKETREEEIDRLTRITEEINGKINQQLTLRFRTDEDTGIDLFQLVERDTGEVVRQIPSEEILEFTRKFQSTSGLLFSEQA